MGSDDKAPEETAIVESGTPTETIDVSKPAKLMRLGAMTRQMLEELRLAPLDEQGRTRMREIYERSVNEVKDILSPELQQELGGFSIPFSDQVPTESELRIAQAQLMGWLEGLFHGIQAALWTQQAMAQQQAAQFPRAMPPGATQDKPSGYL
jgi:hypothetical protein